jgi:hypothetical protein
VVGVWGVMARSLLAVVVVLGAGLSVGIGSAGGGGDVPVGSGAEPSGRLLWVTSGNRLTSVDVATGRSTTRRVAVASCGPSVYVTGGHVVFAVLRKTRTIVYSIPVELDRAPRTLGSAHAFVPSAVDGRVWLAGTRCTRRNAAGVKEVTVHGKVTARSRGRVPGWLTGAVEDGLVVQRGESVFTWDPATGRNVRQLDVGPVSGTRANRVVACTRGNRCRGMSIVDTGTGAVTSARLEPPHRLSGVALLSPDGSMFATPVLAKRRWALAIGESDDGALAVVPGSRTGRQYPDLAWSPSSGWLFFRGERGRVMAYRPGERRAVALSFRLPRDAVNFMAG